MHPGTLAGSRHVSARETTAQHVNLKHGFPVGPIYFGDVAQIGHTWEAILQQFGCGFVDL
jgi:hypothetical protein